MRLKRNKWLGSLAVAALFVAQTVAHTCPANCTMHASYQPPAQSDHSCCDQPDGQKSQDSQSEECCSANCSLITTSPTPEKFVHSESVKDIEFSQAYSSSTNIILPDVPNAIVVHPSGSPPTLKHPLYLTFQTFLI